MLNSWQPNGRALNGPGSTTGGDWEALLPAERFQVYVLDIGPLRLPISSAQATMRLTGQSFLQVVVPNGEAFVEPLAALLGEPMLLRTGYRLKDGTLTPLEIIATAPFQLSRSDEGSASYTLTLSGYGAQPTLGSNQRTLRGTRYRSIEASGRRRVRASIDMFLRPGHLAEDTDGTIFTVGVLQYFINATGDFMEVIENG